MKELYGGMLIAAALLAAVGSGLGGGSGPSKSRAEMWDDLRGRGGGEVAARSRTITPTTPSFSGRSAEEITEPVMAFAGEMTERASHLGRHMGAEMGLPALVASAASAITDQEDGTADELAGSIGISPGFLAAIDPFSSPRRSGPGALQGASGGALAYAPLPVPRPAPEDRVAEEEETLPQRALRDGVLGRALDMLQDLGRAALTPSEDAPEVTVVPALGTFDPEQPRARGYSDRDLPGLNPGPPRDPFSELTTVYRDRAPGDTG